MFSYMYFGVKIRGIGTIRPIKNEIYRRGKSTKQKLLEMVQFTVQITFYFDEI